jgi:ABC-type Zn uptake system ZnuABC Zn-binding protein ZnuA
MRSAGLIRRITEGLLVCASILGSASCGAIDDTGDIDSADPRLAREKLMVVATTQEIEALTREVAGDLVELHGIIPAGGDPHGFEPRASDLVAIEGADLILRHGIGLDEWLDDTLEAGSDATVVTVTEGIELREAALEQDEHEDEAEGGEAEGADEDDEHAEEGLDPHVWHDPDNVKIMVDEIAAALDAADTANASTYDANAAAYKRKLDETKAQVQALIDEIPVEDRKLVTNHDAFGYFARAFGLQVVGAVIPSTNEDAEATAAETAELLETIEREGVKAIFAETSANPDLARTLAQDAGIKIVEDLMSESLGEPGSGANTVDSMLLTNAQKISDALK